jgi:glutamyl-tRNA reductase
VTILEQAPSVAYPTGLPGAAVLALVTHARSVPSLRREAFASELAALGEGPGHVVVHTCHRVELYVAPETFLGELPNLPAGGRLLDDAAAVRHLISVGCGLDSAIFGETQILHQLRETVAERQGERALDPALDRLFGGALRAGRAAHAWFNGSPRSLADVALDRIEKAIGPLDGRRILVVGVGRMGRLAAFAAVRRGCSVIVTNRGLERGAQLAREVSGTTLPFGIDGALDGLDELDGVVVAIGGAWPVGPRDTDRLTEQAVPIVDLSSPPAVSEALREGLGARFVSVDDLAEDDHGPGDRVRRRLDTLISETSRDYCLWLRRRQAVPAIHAVVETAEQHRRAEIERLRRRVPALAGEDLAMVEQMSHRLVAAILHAPLAALNEDASGDLERAARELFGV